MQLRGIWGYATAWLDRRRGFGWIDAVLLMALGGILYGLVNLGREWTGELRPTVEIDLDSNWALVGYTFFSMTRGLIAYLFSLLFTLAYGYWAAKDHVAERVLVPALDILQSIPVLGFMPGLVLSLVAAFPDSNVGLELAAVIMIFTGQAWNMTFSFYHSVRSVPADLQEAATVYRFNWWERFKWVELPFSTIGLVWNSMMSMAGGWFFLMISESFTLGTHDFRLPGIGSYMTVAVERGRTGAMLKALVAMVVMIVALDQLLWRPVVAWAQKFRVEEASTNEAVSSWFLNFLRRSRMIAVLAWLVSCRARWFAQRAPSAAPDQSLVVKARVPSTFWEWPLRVLFGLLAAALAYGAWRLLVLLQDVEISQWLEILEAGLWTLSRVLAATALGTLWALPAGLAIGLSPKLSRIFQPVVQVVASFPAPMLFPLVIAVLHWAGVSLGWGSIVLMLLGTQWYILFNVIAGAMAVPADLREATKSYRMGRWQRFWILYFPSVFAFLVTGWVTAAGGAWNASIVAEYVTSHGQVMTTDGLGAQISIAAAKARFPALAASVLVMSILVVTFNRIVWQRLYRLATTRYSL